MKKTIQISSLFLPLLFSIAFMACEPEEDDFVVQEGALTLLPLGDSRVQGARPEYESYRYELWKNLLAADWTVDFLGTREDEATYPDVQGLSFDRDHEGTGGAVTSDILTTVDAIAPNRMAKVVLLGIGGNDLVEGATAQETVDRIRQIIETIQSKRDTVTIFVEQIPPGRSDFMTTSLLEVFEAFNAAITDLPNTTSTETARVIVVDMAAGWSDDYMADEVHYNSAGAKVVADRYFEAIEMYVEE